MQHPSIPIHAAFVMEQHIGHYTFYQNLRHFINRQGKEWGIAPHWVEVTYTQSTSLIQRMPILGCWKGTLIGRSQVLNGLREPYDIAFFNTQVPAAISGNGVQKRPYVLCTDITPIQYDRIGEQYGHIPDRDGIVRSIKYRANRRLFQNAARILAWSSWVRGSLVNDYGVDPGKIEVLAPGIDLDLWKPPIPADISNPTPKAPLRILFVGGDFHRKGGDILLESFRRLPPGAAELHLVTRTILPAEPGVTIYQNLLPNMPALRELYQSADVFALPSKAEAFGIAAIEAGAAGLPVIATNTGGLSDTVTPGITGFLINPGSVGELTRSLLWMAEHPSERAQMGKAARERVEDCFDARKNAARILDILVEIVKARTA